jgi:Xaa-Pro aminopeptidase
LRQAVTAAGLDALFITNPPNLRYLTGFTGSTGFLLVSAGATILLVDPRYAVQAGEEAGGAAEVLVEPTNLWDRLKRVLAGHRLPSLGFESATLTVRDVERLQGAATGRLEPAAGLVESLRASKDAGEVAAIRAAAALALEALDAVIPTIRPGQSELAIAARLESELRVRGSDWHPFPTIVASGPRSALPHARSTGREVLAGDLLLLDFGAEHGGYCADLTRTVVVGRRADQRQRGTYAAVHQAQRAAASGLRVGMTGREADALARDVLESAGFGAAFSHSLGHGLGLEVHEDPRLGRTAEAALPAGAVVTVEPGVYFEGWGGVRLEDDVHLAADGPELLSPGAPELLELL